MDRDIFTESHSPQGEDARSEQMCATEAPLLPTSLSALLWRGPETDELSLKRGGGGEERKLTDALWNLDCCHGDDTPHLRPLALSLPPGSRQENE